MLATISPDCALLVWNDWGRSQKTTSIRCPFAICWCQGEAGSHNASLLAPQQFFVALGLHQFAVGTL
jgi:hypothetical protein